MDGAHIVYVLKEVGATKIREGSTQWVTASCPFSRRHKSGGDQHPSFGVKITSEGCSTFHCYGCRLSGTLKQMVWRLEAEQGLSLKHLYALVQNDGAVDFARLADKISKASFEKKPVTIAGVTLSSKAAAKFEQAPVLLEEAALKPYSFLDLEPYLYLTGPQRRLTEDTVTLWELGWDAQSFRVTIPIRDLNRNLVGLSRRLLPGYAWQDKKVPKYLHSKGFRRDLYLYGEHLVDKGKPCYICEGFFDAIFLKQAGYTNAVAIMGSYISDVQLKKLLQLFSYAFIVGDGDEAGYKMADSIASRLSGRIPFRIVRLPPGKDPDQLEEEELNALLGARAEAFQNRI